MKTRNEIPSASLPQILLTLLVVFGVPRQLPAQLVADGGTTNVTTAINLLPGNLIVGTNGGNTILNIIAPGAVTNAYGHVGLNVTSTGNQAQVRDSGAVWRNTQTLYVGDQGAGNSLVISNGALTSCMGLVIGNTNSSTGNQVIVTGPGSVLSNGFVFSLGKRGSGNQLVVSNGAAVTGSPSSMLGNDSSSSNNVALVTGPGSVWNTGNLNIGFAGSGNQLVVSNGGVVTSSTVDISWQWASSNNTVLIADTGSLWTCSSGPNVGGSGNQLVISNGAGLAGNAYQVGLAGTNNMALVTDPGSFWSNSGRLYVGAGSNNQLVVSNSAVVVSTDGFIGNFKDNFNTVIITGAGSAWTNFGIFKVGAEGAGNQLRLVAGGSAICGDSTYIGYNSGSDNLLLVAGGSLAVTTNLDVRRGTLQLDSGTVTTTNFLATNGSAGTIVFNGGTLAVSNTVVANGSPLVVGDGVSAATYQILGHGLHTFADGLVITNNGRLEEKISSRGAMISGPVTVRTGGTIDLTPGLAAFLVLSNSPTLQGQVALQIIKAGAAKLNNQIQVATALNYGGSLVVTKFAGGSALAAGDSFKLFNATGYGGAFSSLSLPAAGAGLMWTNKLLLDGSIAVVAQIPPVISGVTKSDTNLVFKVTGGSPGGPFSVLTSTNVALPLSSWTTNRTGNFDWLGNLTLTNVIDPATPQRFFTIRAP